MTSYTFTPASLCLACIFTFVGGCVGDFAADDVELLQHSAVDGERAVPLMLAAADGRRALVATEQQLVAEIRDSVLKRLHSEYPDWTLRKDAWMLVITPIVGLLLALVVHRSAVAAMLRTTQPVVDTREAPVWYAPLLLQAVACVLVGVGGPEWGAAQTSLLFIVLGYGIAGAQRPFKLVAPLLGSYLFAVTCYVVLGGAGPHDIPLAVAARFLPIEVLSSMPLDGVALVVALFGGAAACLSMSHALVQLCTGAGWLPLFGLWAWSLLGGPMGVLSAEAAIFGTPWLSLPVRLQVLPLVAGIIVRSMPRPKNDGRGQALRIFGLFLAVRYAHLSHVSFPDGFLHATSQGALLPLQAFLVWIVASFLPKSTSRRVASPAAPEVCFGALFLAPAAAGRFAHALGWFGRWEVILMVAASCYLMEWTVFHAFSWYWAVGRKPEKIPAEQHFLGRYKKEGRTLLQAWGKQFVQVFLYFAVFGCFAAMSYLRYEEKYGPRWLMASFTRPGPPLLLVHGWFWTVMWFALIGASASTVMTVFGQILYPAPLREDIPRAAELQEGTSPRDEFVMIFRYCTRGTNPTLVAANAVSAHQALLRSGFDESRWRLEAVTDHPLLLNTRCPSVPIVETVVPADYKCPMGAKYKARALHYAALYSDLVGRPTDWIVHLDEETRFDEHTVCAIYQHCKTQNEAVSSGAQSAPDMGHGAILYNTNGVQLENLFTALLDTVRVGDDFSKFRFQYSCLNYAAQGMHGSWVVIQQGVQTGNGFDWGEVGSVTEDTYFAMMANTDYGVGSRWIDAFMYEQSPFTVMDVIRQRARWFHGLWHCTLFGRNRISSSANWVLTVYVAFWASCWVTFPIRILLGALGCTDPAMEMYSEILRDLMRVNYLLGFVMNFSPFAEGFARWGILCVLNFSIFLFFSSMTELAGMLKGLQLVCTTTCEFYIVKKEKTDIGSHCEKASSSHGSGSGCSNSKSADAHSTSASSQPELEPGLEPGADFAQVGVPELEASSPTK